uniref:Uncharacterized protein n=2 Tax=Heliothis virescens TaxID=7102 RepID=A0A2A4J973_HELVI
MSGRRGPRHLATLLRGGTPPHHATLRARANRRRGASRNTARASQSRDAVRRATLRVSQPQRANLCLANGRPPRRRRRASTRSEYRGYKTAGRSDARPLASRATPHFYIRDVYVTGPTFPAICTNSHDPLHRDLPSICRLVASSRTIGGHVEQVPQLANHPVGLRNRIEPAGKDDACKPLREPGEDGDTSTEGLAKEKFLPYGNGSGPASQLQQHGDSLGTPVTIGSRPTLGGGSRVTTCWSDA